MTFQGGDFEAGRVKGGGGVRKGVAIGGGGGLLAAIIAGVFALLNGQGAGGAVSNALQAAQGDGAPAQVQPADQTELGVCSVEQANTQRDCRLAATAYALDAYWQPVVEAQGVQFQMPGIVSFTDQTDTACGPATTAVGPFYCPGDQTIYIDLGFYDDMFAQLGAADGPLAEEYVTAHEYGHHLQNLLGIFAQHGGSGTGADSDSVRTELQADCLAGVWAGNAATTKRPGTDTTFLQPISQQQLANALQAASAVGDDRIQQGAGQAVNSETWTHGSAAERQHWFTAGYDSKSLSACDTFGTSSLG